MAKSWRAGFTHPLGLLLLSSSLALAITALLGAPWRERGLWLFFWGVLAYAAVVCVAVTSRRPIAEKSEEAPDAPDVAITSDGSADMARLTEQALRHLREPAALARCQLAQHLPHCLTDARGLGNPIAAPSTPLETARLLRTVIESSMEKLRASVADESAGLEYAILYSEYVLGLPNTAIMSRHSVSEGTFHRRRRAAVRALANELELRESLLSSRTTS